MGNGNLPPLPMGYKIEEPENEGTPPLPKGYSIEQPVKKKEQTVPSNFGSLAGKYGYTSEEKQQKPIDPTEFAKEYNKNFEQFTGHKELELGSSLPQIAKQREQRKYLKNRAIEETEFKPLLNNVQTGTTSPQQLASLYKKPYGKKIVQDVVEEVMPGASQYGLDPEVFGNEEKWNTIAQNINVKNRPQGVEAQNQYYYNLDNEIYNDLDQLELGNVSVSGGTGGGAANVSSFKLSGVNTNSPEEIGAAISQIESADFVKGKDGQKVEKEPLLKKLNEKLFYLSSQKEIHPDIYALSDKAKEAITRVNMQRERGESISPEEFAKNDQLNQEHFQLGLNFIKDAKPGMYANVSRGLNERGVVSDLDFEQIAGIGQEIYNQKIFREGAVNPEAIGKESKLDYQTYQSKKANYAAILSEEINRLGYKNRAKVPQSAIDKAVARHPELTNVEIINDIRKDEANGGYGVTKGGLLNSFFRGMASPIKGINQTYNALTESPVDNYLNSRRLDYGDQVIADKKGNYRDVLPSERGNIFNEISEGFGQFITQVGLSKGMGKIIQAPYSAAAGSVPRAAMTGAQASNVAAYPGTFLTTAIQTYGSAYTDLLNKTGDPNTAKLGATVNTIGQSAIEAFIMPDVKIADKAKGLLADARAKFADDIVSLVKKGEGKEAAKSVVRNFAENSAKIMGGNITEENLQQLTDYTTEALFSPSTIKDRNLGNELWETTKGTVLQMAIPTLLGAGGQSKQQQKFGKDALNTGAINFDEYKDALGKSLINGEIDQQKHDEAIQILGLHKESINNAPKRDAKGEVVSEERQLEYAYQNTVAEVNAQLAANQKDPVQREPFEKKIQEADAVKRKIYYGEEIKGLPKEEEVVLDTDEDDNLLTRITSSENVGTDEKREGLQYFIDKVGEAPIASQRFGEGVVEQLLPRVPTAKLEENYKFLAEIDPEGQDADAIAKELDRRANEANPPIDQQRELDMGDEGLRGEESGVVDFKFNEDEESQLISIPGVPKEFTQVRIKKAKEGYYAISEINSKVSKNVEITRTANIDFGKPGDSKYFETPEQALEYASKVVQDKYSESVPKELPSSQPLTEVEGGVGVGGDVDLGNNTIIVNMSLPLDSGVNTGLVKNSKGAVYHDKNTSKLEKLGYSKEQIDKLSQAELDEILAKNIENPNVETSAKMPLAEKQTTTQEFLNEANKEGGRFAELAKALKQFFGIDGVETEIVKGLKDFFGKNNDGDYANNKIRIDEKAKNKLQTFLHEAIHKVTVDKLLQFERGDYSKLSKQDIEAIQNLTRIFNESKAKIHEFLGGGKGDRTKGHYGFTNVHEFISEAFTNPEFQSLLKNLPTEGNNPTIFKQFLDAVAKFLGLKDASILNDIFYYTENLNNKAVEQSLSKQESGGKAPVTKPEGKSDVVVDKVDDVGDVESVAKTFTEKLSKQQDDLIQSIYDKYEGEEASKKIKELFASKEYKNIEEQINQLNPVGADLSGFEKTLSEIDAKDYAKYREIGYRLVAADKENGYKPFKVTESEKKQYAELRKKFDSMFADYSKNVDAENTKTKSKAVEQSLKEQPSPTKEEASVSEVNKKNESTQEATKATEPKPTIKEPSAKEKSTEDTGGAKEPPTGKEKVGEEGGRLNDKGILNKLYNAKRTPETAKEGFKKEGLEYETKSQKEAQEVANALLDEVGIDEAVAAAEAMKFDGDVNSLIFAEALNRLKEQEDKATTPEAKLEAATRFAEVGITYDKMARYGGRFNAAINFFYQKSPLGIVMSENSKRKDDFNQWAKPKDKSWKEFHEDLMKEPEFENIIKENVQEELKKERSESRKARKEKVHKSIDDTLAKWAKKLSADLPPGTKSQGIGIEEVFKAVGATMKAAYDAGEVVAKVVQDAINYISKELGNDKWGVEEFRKEQEARLNRESGSTGKVNREKRIKYLKDELERIRFRKPKIPKEKSETKREVSDEEQILLDEIEQEQAQWDAEKDAARQAANDYEKMETERNRQLKRVGELNDKIEILRGGKLPEGQKRVPKKDTPEIEALKAEKEALGKSVRESIAHENKMKGLEAELQRLKDRKEKEPKEESKKVMTEDERQIRNEIESERKAWAVEKNIEKLNEELIRVKNRQKKLTTPKEKRELTDEEKSLTGKIKAEKELWAKEVAPAKKLIADLKAVQKSLDEYQRRIDEKDILPNKNNQTDSPQLKALKDKRDAKRKEYEAMKKAMLKPQRDAELKMKVLDRFRKKLQGLTEKQKDEVIRRSHRKLIENGALDYQDLRDIIADVVGRGELTPQDAAKIKELVAKTNEVQKAAEKLREERTDEAFVNFRKAEVEAGKATKELNELFYNKPDIIKRLTSIMQLSTLGIPALINNPIYNLWNQATLRFPVGLINDLVDRGMALAAKTFGKNYEREYNVLETQVEFWEKLGFGAKEAFTQLYSGLNRQDYLQKEVYGQQIRPVKAFRDLIEYTQGKRKLSKTQMMDKAIQSTIGIPAEMVARALNIGDKPQRFAAEGSQASAFAKTLGLQGMDYKLFVEFPREEAYRAYKAQGLSDEVAAEKADYVKEAILKEGQRSTFQQDNILNDVITRAASIFGGKDSGTANLVKTLTISPYIKIPSNAFWSFYNLLNPEVAILQTGIHAGRAKAYGNKGETVKSKLQQREARYWMAHAIVGMAMRAAVIALVKAGVFTPGSDEDDSKKERDAVSYFDKPGSVTIGDIQISNRWFGQWGMMGNAIAKKYIDATPEQRQAQDDFWNVILGGMEREGLKELQNGIFANTSSILQAVDSGNPDRYLTNTLNMLANIVQPAAIAQINRASLDEVPSSKGDSFLDKLNKNFAQRSVLYRKAFGVQIDSKRDIWGQTIPKGGNILSRLFGISRVNPQLFARPIYNDYLETSDSGFLPPAVLPVLNDIKLDTKQYDRLQYYIGEERKRLVEPYVNDMAIIEGFNTTYDDIKDPEDKKFVLQYLYNEGRDLGLEKFYQDFPELKKEKTFKDYGAEIKKDLFKILSKYGKRKK